jgi:hypothetical protein
MSLPIERKATLPEPGREFTGADAVMIFAAVGISGHDPPGKGKLRPTGQLATGFLQNGILTGAAWSHKQDDPARPQRANLAILK